MHFKNDDHDLIQQIGDEQYDDFLEAVFDRGRNFQKKCNNPSCNKGKATKICSRCKTARYCSKECQRIDWKRHKNLCNQHMKQQAERTVFMSEKTQKEHYLSIINCALKNLNIGIEFACNIITEYAVDEKCILPQTFMQQHKTHPNMNDFITFTTENTALIIVSRCLHFFRIPRRKKDLELIFPMMHQLNIYGQEFDQFIIFIVDEFTKRFGELLEDRSDGFNDYIDQYHRPYWSD